MSGSNKFVAFDSDKKGMKRVTHIFKDIILPRSQPISTKQIHERLIAEGYDISRCQLGRILNTYSRDFGVDRTGTTDEHGSIYWQATKASARMSEAEAMLYVMLVEYVGLERLIALLNKDAGKFCLQQLERTAIRVETSKNTPTRLLQNFQENIRLHCLYEKNEDYDSDILNSFIAALNNSHSLEITSGEVPSDTVDIFTPTSLFEKNGELYVTGHSEFYGKTRGTNHDYCVGKISSAIVVDLGQSLFNRPRR